MRLPLNDIRQILIGSSHALEDLREGCMHWVSFELIVPGRHGRIIGGIRGGQLH